ncbi:MAG: type III PLP-dependent enzyme [Isosphaeraceae bacterium]
MARHFGESGGELLVDGLRIGDVAAQFGTPLFVYDLGVVGGQLQALRTALPPPFEICYSVKANPNLGLLRFLVARGCGLEIASQGELAAATAAGCPAQRILFAGPGKTEDELDAALAAGVGEIHVESRTEAVRLGTLARRRTTRARIALRVNPGAAVEGGGLRMGGKPAPFGIDEDQLEEVVRTVEAEPALDLVGLHLYMGTQILDHELLLRQYTEGLEIAGRLQRRLGRRLETIDFGGGYGVPYFGHERPLDLEQFGRRLAPWARDATSRPEFAATRFVVEPGRFLVAEAGLYVTRVTDVKVSRGKKFVIVDGGMHHHLAASGNLGQTIKRNFPVALLDGLGRSNREPVDVVGPLCTPLDVLARAVPLPPVAIGDLIGVFQSGAYGRSASPLGFLSRSSPAEVIVHQGRARLARRHGRPQDFLDDQILE